MKKTLLIALYLSLIIVTQSSYSSQDSNSTVKLIVFYSSECEECQEFLQDFLPIIEQEYPFIAYKMFEISSPDSYHLLTKFENHYTITVDDWPAVFIGDKVLIGKKAIYDQLSKHIITLKKNHNFAWPNESLLKDKGLTKPLDTVQNKIASLTIITVLAAGLLDGINPCAFMTIIFLIFYLNFVGKNKKEIIVIGIFYTVAVLITYFAVGLGLLNIIKPLLRLRFFTKALYILAALLAFGFAFFSFLDYLKAKKNQFRSMFLQLTHSLKEKIHRTIREKAKIHSLILFALATGIFIALLELPCTGQVYFPIIIAISNKVLYQRSILLLALYNIMFILPLVGVFIVSYYGISSTIINDLFKKHIATIKLTTSILFLLLGIILLFFAF